MTSDKLISLLLFVFITACNGPSSDPIQVFKHAEEGVYAANISPDGTLAVVSTTDKGIVVWDLATKSKRFQWSHQGEGNNLVSNIHIAADNSFAVTSDREAFAIWDLASGEPAGFWRIDESSIRDIAVSNNGRGILVGRGNGKVLFFEPFTSRRLEFIGHQEKINSIDISPNGFYALTGGNDYVAYLWDTRSGQVIHRFSHASRVTKVALDDKGRYVFTADSKHKARIWDAQTGKEISHLKYMERQKIFSTASFSSNGKYLLTGSPSRRLALWNVKTGEKHDQWQVAAKEGSRPQTSVVYGAGFLGDNRVISESSSGLAEIWAYSE